MDYPYWGELVWLLVGVAAMLVMPAIFGILFSSAHNHKRSQAAIVNAAMAHKSTYIMNMQGINPLVVLMVVGWLAATFGFMPYFMR
jgi:hypothetical protein